MAMVLITNKGPVQQCVLQVHTASYSEDLRGTCEECYKCLQQATVMNKTGKIQ